MSSRQDRDFASFVQLSDGNWARRTIDNSFSSRSQIAQSRPSDTSANLILTSDSSNKYVIATIMICNTSGIDTTYSIYHDNDGTTYDESTALFFDVSLRGGNTHKIDIYLAMNGSGNIAVQSGNSSAITFTIYGAQVV